MLHIARIFAIVVLSVVLAIGTALAVEPQEVMRDPALEARARVLSQQLRCLVCQNQSIDDSNAELARDLRVLVRERLAAGDSDAAVLAYVEARYGEFVLLRPRFNVRTLALWLAPLLLLAAAAFVLVRAARHRVQPPASAPSLTAEEQQRLEKILQSDR